MSVPITDDAVEDDGETFKLMLSNASGAGFANNDNEATGTIRNSETTTTAELTAAFRDMPAEHDGERAFRFRVAFSEDIGISFRSLREDAFTVTGGRVTGGKRVDGRRDLFEMTVRGVGARMRAGLRASNRRARHLPMRYETGLPSSVIRFRTLHASTASRRCPDELRARRQSPTIDVYRKNAFSTRAG